MQNKVPINIFYCFATEDQLLQGKLDEHLQTLKMSGWIVSGHQGEIPAGTNWQDEVKKRLQAAHIILLLLSPDFFASKACDFQMSQAIQRHKAKEALVIPLILRPVNWEVDPFLNELDVLPEDASAITTSTNRDAALLHVANGIQAQVMALLKGIYIISAPEDATEAHHLQQNLEAQSIIVWKISEKRRGSRSDREKTVQQMIRTSHMVILIASPFTRYNRVVQEELRIAHLYKKRILPIWIAGNFPLESIPPPVAQSSYIDARTLDNTTILEEINTLYNELPLLEKGGLPLPPPIILIEPRNPYKALEPFSGKDVHDFFGREALTDKLVKVLQEALNSQKKDDPNRRLLTIVGASGVGKSSVVQAGLLPRLQGDTSFGSSEWVYLRPMLPGAHPIESLALTLSHYQPRDKFEDIYNELMKEEARGLYRCAFKLTKLPTTRVVLVVDQFEELFTQTSEDERQQFIDLLVVAATEPQSPIIVILTLRADFYDRPMKYPELRELIQAHLEVIPPMEVDDLRAVIEGPAALPDVQLTFDDRLVGDLLFETRGQAGALPMLEFTLNQLFQRRRGNQLTQQAYKAIGGVKGAILQQAEETYTGLSSDEHRDLARTLFLRLVDPGITEQDTTRHRAALVEFVLPDTRQSAIIQEVIQAFVRARLLVTSEVAGTQTIEVSHEVLIREWPLLSDWLHEAREDIRLQHIISEDVREWKQRDMPKDRLYRGDQLSEAQTWAARNVPSQDEEQFLQESAGEQEQQALMEQNQLALQRRASRRQKYVIGLSGIISLVVVIGLIAVFFLQTSLSESTPANVTNMNDHGSGSLRDAILHAPRGGLITFARNVQGTIVLTGGEIQITKDLTISGPGVSDISISGNGKNRVFIIGAGYHVTIIGLTIKNGYTADFYGGACILNGPNSNVELVHSEVTGCKSVGQYGGGVSNWAGALMLTSCVIVGNVGSQSGGGIFNNGTLTVTNSTITQNTAEYGGGIFHMPLGMLTLLSSTISGNTATENGGGIQSTGSFVIEQSTIGQNTARQGDGGGIFAIEGASAGTVNTLFYTTISQNTANKGGGMYVSTPVEGFSENISSANVDMSSSIVAGDKAQEGADIWGPVYVSDANLVQSVDTYTSFHITEAYLSDQNATSDAMLQYTQDHLIIGKSPDFGSLSENQGPTETYALRSGSPAIDVLLTNDTGLCNTKTQMSVVIGDMPIISVNTSVDQRGFPRPNKKGCDLGAYQTQ